MNEAIKKMLEVPGTYAVGQEGSLAWCLVEVDEQGQAHQLTTQGKRDGILSPDGWYDNAIVMQSRKRLPNPS